MSFLRLAWHSPLNWANWPRSQAHVVRERGYGHDVMFTLAKLARAYFKLTSLYSLSTFQALVAGVMDSTLTLAAEESEYEPFRPQPYLVPVVFEKEPEQDSDHMKGT